MDIPREDQVGRPSAFLEEKSPGCTAAFNLRLRWCSLPTENADTTALLKMSAKNSATALIIFEQGIAKRKLRSGLLELLFHGLPIAPAASRTPLFEQQSCCFPPPKRSP
jgi:hypothetical protein